jgi:DNA-binding GntR family transcriptional regulator
VRIELERMCITQSIARFNLLMDVRLDEAMAKLISTAVLDENRRHVITDEWGLAHIEFHEILVAGCRNEVLLQMRRQLFDQSEPYRLLAKSLRRDYGDLERDHLPLVEAVHARDSEQASAMIVEHIRASTRMLLSSRFAELA